MRDDVHVRWILPRTVYAALGILFAPTPNPNPGPHFFSYNISNPEKTERYLRKYTNVTVCFFIG